MKRKMSTSDSSSIDTSICKKIKPDLDTSDDDDDDDDGMLRKPTRSSACVSAPDKTRRQFSQPIFYKTIEINFIFLILLQTINFSCPLKMKIGGVAVVSGIKSPPPSVA